MIGGRCIWNIRYADDTTMVAKSREECNVMGETLRRASKDEAGLDINKNKTSAMTIHGEGEIEIEAEKIEKVKKVKFLGSYITPKGDSCVDIKNRIGLAKTVTNNMSEVWKAKDSRSEWLKL